MVVGFFFFFVHTLTFYNIPYEVMFGNLSVIFGCPLICKTVEYFVKSDKSYKGLIPQDVENSTLI